MDKKQLLYDLARSYLHTPYIWGGDDATGLDCSGLVIELLKSFGIVPSGFDATAKGLFNILKSRTGSTVTPTDQFGRLVFFGRDVSEISHVAFCLGGGLILEAGGGDSKTTSEAEAVKRNAFVRVRPLKSRSDLVAILHMDWGF